MQNNIVTDGTEIPVGELRQQIEYARIISGDLFNLFAGKSEKNAVRAYEYSVIGKKLSMILDFLFQAGLWCDVLEEHFLIGEKEKTCGN